MGSTLLIATNPENGTVTYTYNTNMTLASKTDAKGQNFTYQYDTYNRLTSITWTNAPGGSQVLRSFMYDTNTITILGVSYSSFSTYGLGRLVAVQNASFNTQYGTTQGTLSFTEMYGYTQAGQPNAKMLQAIESTSAYPINLTANYTYDNEGKMASVSYPNSGPTYTYGFDSMYRPVSLTSAATR